MRVSAAHLQTLTGWPRYCAAANASVQGKETKEVNFNSRCWIMYERKLLTHAHARITRAHTHTHTHRCTLAYTCFLGSWVHVAGIRPAVPVTTNQSIQLRPWHLQLICRDWRACEVWPIINLHLWVMDHLWHSWPHGERRGRRRDMR